MKTTKAKPAPTPVDQVHIKATIEQLISIIEEKDKQIAKLISELHRHALTPDEPYSPGEEILAEAARITRGDRNASYGPPTENFDNISEMWTTILGHKLKPGCRVTAREVADMNIAQKLCRNIASPKRDNYTDIAGYAKCGEACRQVGEALLPSVESNERHIPRHA